MIEYFIKYSNKVKALTNLDCINAILHLLRIQLLTKHSKILLMKIANKVQPPEVSGCH